MTATVRDPALECHMYQHRDIKDWTLDPSSPQFPKDKAEDIAHGVIPCVCRDGWLDSIVFSPSTGRWAHYPLKCSCKFYTQFYKQWGKNVPLRYRDVRLTLLRPSDKSRLSPAVQKAEIEKLIANPDASYAFFGPAGTSKTTFTVALYWNAFCKDQAAHNKKNSFHSSSCWRITAKQLLDEFHSYATNRDRVDEEGNYVGGAAEPTVTRRKINRLVEDGFKPHLFLEEIDKVKGTEFKLQSLFEVIDAIYEQNGQLVINTNMTLPEFSSAFGAAFERRICEMCTVKNYF